MPHMDQIDDIKRSKRRLALAMVFCAMGLPGALPALAQVPPSPAEGAQYQGLHAAAWRGDVQKIEKLAAAGANLNVRDPHGRTPLHVASFARQRGAIRALVKAGADINLLENDRYDGVTIASVADDEETLRVLLSLGASAKQMTSRYDGTALIAAAHLGHDGVVRQLIAAGAPLDHVNNLHWTALIEAIVLGDGGPRHQATLKALLDAGASVKTDRQAGSDAAAAGTRQRLQGHGQDAGDRRHEMILACLLEVVQFSVTRANLRLPTCNT
jgi:ankyrin repeat protein